MTVCETADAMCFCAMEILAVDQSSHVNNLFSVMLGYTQLTLNDLAANDPVRADLEEVRNAGHSASALTSQLLACNRQQVLQPRVLDVNQTLAGTNPTLRRLLGEDVELDVITFLDVGRILADPGQLEQVVVNLALNARDAMPEGGKLAIETANVELDAAFAQRAAVH